MFSNSALKVQVEALFNVLTPEHVNNENFFGLQFSRYIHHVKMLKTQHFDIPSEKKGVVVMKFFLHSGVYIVCKFSPFT